MGQVYGPPSWGHLVMEAWRDRGMEAPEPTPGHVLGVFEENPKKLVPHSGKERDAQLDLQTWGQR